MQPLPGQRVVVPFLTHFADLTSWEFAQKLREKVLPVLEEKGIPVITVGLGSPENAREFARVLDYPLENLYADEDGSCYKALGEWDRQAKGGKVLWPSAQSIDGV